MKVLFIGAGRWGLALASVLGNNGHEVRLLSRDKAEGEALNSSGIHPFFPDFRFPASVKMTSDEAEAAAFSEVAVLSLPVQVSFDYLSSRQSLIKGKKVLLTGKGMVGQRILTEVLSPIIEEKEVAVLSGPSFASEVIKRKPTCVSIGSKEEGLALFFQSLFSSPYFRTYVSADIVGLELCGALKNVYALGAGMIDRAIDSANTRAAYLTRALHEMSRLVLSRGGERSTVYGLSGVGDLFMTCTSSLSRNYQFGYHFNEPGYQTNGVAEGVYTLASLLSSIPNLKDLLPIAFTIGEVVERRLNFQEAIEALMGRKLKKEID